jgi:GTP:adenosylcobinamide-phosphate guanylyltransferase
MDALVTAGGIPQPGEPLYEHTHGGPKALLEICGKPMVQWVLDALDASSKVDHVLIIGLEEGSGVTSSKAAAYLPNQGGLLQNMRAGMNKMLEINPLSKHLLAVSSDIPAITPEMVDWLVGEVEKTDLDAYYTVITRQTMEKRYPGSKRSFYKLRDMEICGGDMNAIRTRLGTEQDATMERIVATRKNAFKQAALIGYDTLFLLLFRLLTLEKAVKIVTKRLNVTGRALICPYAELGMDVDKPNQLEMVRDDLARQVAV